MSANLRIAAMVAIADGRFDDAIDVLDALKQNRPVTPGVCRYCGCTEVDPCTVIVQPGPEFPPAPVTCAWMDRDETVCSNKRCIDHWLTDAADAPEGAEQSRIVLP